MAGWAYLCRKKAHFIENKAGGDELGEEGMSWKWNALLAARGGFLPFLCAVQKIRRAFPLPPHFMLRGRQG